MFYILMVIGIFFIILGFALETKVNKNYDGEPKQFIGGVTRENDLEDGNTNTVESLEGRIDNLEKLLFQKTLREEEDKIDFNVSKGINKNKRIEDYNEKYKLLLKYEKEKKSLDEIAKLLEMNKGEILLLKNIYKDS